jgi:hypothetical protein
MKVVELVGKDIMMAYDGKYLAPDFGYSCANFNVRDNMFSHDENDEETFDFYTLNPKNISCFVCYNDRGKIWGRRMFFKGKSLINDKVFEMPYKMGSQVRYLYGYYGAHDEIPFRAITRAVIAKYGDKLIHTDKVAFVDGIPDYKAENSFVMQVERADFNKYPPIDFLEIAPKARALSNFDPSKEFIEVLEKDLRIKDIEFHHAYRYNPNRGKVNYRYTTWDQHKGNATKNDITTAVQEEEDDDVDMKIKALKVGDVLSLKDNGGEYIITKITNYSIFIDTHSTELELYKDEIDMFFDL